MRVALALAIFLGSAQPALAGDPPGIVRPIQIRDFAHVQPIVGQPLRQDLSLRIETLHIQVASQSEPLIGGDSHIQQRIATAMFDFYPAGGIGGFHLSAGMHYYSRYNANLEAQRVTDGKLFIPRGRTGAGIRSGFNRYTPAMTAGFSQPLGGDAMIGLEAGALVGRAVNAQPLQNMGNVGETRAGINPVANLVIGMRF
jgi:hypothetical protein